MILYLFIFPNNSLPFLNEKHFEIIHLFRANDSTTARHFFVFSTKQCGKSAALGVSWELLLLEVCDERGMVRDGREHNNNNNNNSIYLNTIKNSAKADVVVYGQ